MMLAKRATCAFLVAAAALAGCEAIVEDFEAKGCPTDDPQTCADLGDEQAGKRGCCSNSEEVVWFCENGALVKEKCSDVCDYDPDFEIMTCVQ